MIAEFIDVGALVRWIGGLENQRGHLLIDGFPGSGKSSLARALAVQLQLPHLEIDHLLTHQINEGRPRYVDNVNLQALIPAVCEHPSTIVDAVAALEVADRASIPIKAHIYVKRINKIGKWADQEEVALTHRIDAVAAPSALRVSLRQYHFGRRPHEVCDAVFIRQDHA